MAPHTLYYVFYALLESCNLQLRGCWAENHLLLPLSESGCLVRYLPPSCCCAVYTEQLCQIKQLQLELPPLHTAADHAWISAGAKDFSGIIAGHHDC